MTLERVAPPDTARAGLARPRLGFLGVGSIGLSPMEAMAQTGLVDIVAVAEPDDEIGEAATTWAPNAERVGDLDELVACGLDGVVIATPDVVHGAPAIRALEAGLAVFLDRPLGRSVAETQAVVNAARAADRLLGVDLPYRHVEAMRRIRELGLSETSGASSLSTSCSTPRPRPPLVA